MTDTNYPMQSPETSPPPRGYVSPWIWGSCLIVGVVVVAFLTTGASLETEAQNYIASTLFDPSSAQFRDVRAKRETGIVCGYVNAKNKFGGYVGFRQFVYHAKNGGAIDDGNISGKAGEVVRTGCGWR